MRHIFVDLPVRTSNPKNGMLNTIQDVTENTKRCIAVLSEFCFFSRYLPTRSISICSGLTNIGKNKKCNRRKI